MIINMVGGGGGAALNFKVVPGLTQPGTASENTIWVKAERIGAWYFSATQPENMQEWDVWFPTGTSGIVEFNALKKNNITVTPMSAKQYVDGELVDVTAKNYQGGKWVELIKNIFLFNNGDQCTDITGGWVKADIGANTIPPRVEGNELIIESYSHANFSICNNFAESNWAKFKGEGCKYLYANVSDYSTEGSNPVAYLRIMTSKTNDAQIAQVAVTGAGLYYLPITNITYGQPALVTYNAIMKVTEVYFSDREVN